jgi:hypothetical protein
MLDESIAGVVSRCNSCSSQGIKTLADQEQSIETTATVASSVGSSIAGPLQAGGPVDERELERVFQAIEEDDITLLRYRLQGHVCLLSKSFIG